MFERILIPLDGSEMAELSIPYGEELANKFGSEIILYHVQGRDSEELEHVQKVYLDQLAVTVKQNTSRIDTKAVKVTTKVEAGEPAQNICTLINNNRIDLIIMMAVSEYGLKIGKMMGSVTDHICHTVPIPVMLISHNSQRAVGDQLINNILIPLDGSELSKLALPVGAELAAKLKSSITLFQMAHTIYPYISGNYIDTTNYDQINKNLREMIGNEMFTVEKNLKEKGVMVNTAITTGTDAASEIILASKEKGIDLVLMSTHGRSGLGHWVLGSVAEKVLRYSEVPLLLVNARAS